MTVQVLILDNDHAMRDLLEVAVSRNVCVGRAVASSGEAEEILREGEVDFMLLDLNLGGGDSGEALAIDWAQREIMPPFFLVTGTPEDARLAALANLPLARGIIPKPFQVLELSGRIVAELENCKEQEHDPSA